MSTKRLLSALLLSLLTLPLILTSSEARRQADPSDNITFVIQKKDTVIQPEALSYINSKAVDGIAKVWVFFTDKGIKSRGQFDQIAAGLGSSLTDRAMERRAKVGKQNLDLIDMPVNASYIESIEGTGAILRRASRYLNAASFEVKVSLLDQIAALPFVSEIRPMVGYKQDYGTEAKNEPGELKSDADDLSYGSSLVQIAQINVVQAHNNGYTGAGVLVAMFDTGFRTDHTVFSSIIGSGRLIATWDFVFDDAVVSNELEDDGSAWNHGTYTWSTLGGAWSGNLYGPAYGADFILAKTEDVRSETQVEEDNWVAAMEWADSIGAGVISSSLGYSDWYTVNNYNGDFCVTTVAADIAASRGIVVCNSAGNNGAGTTTINAPADADSILAIGAVSSTGTIASFSSRGPTWDGRIKPEVCAMGLSTRCATPSSTTSLGNVSGTSLSCPLAGGVAALVIEKNPDWTPMQVREAIMMTASRAASPDNTYGWGIIDAWAAMNYQTTPDFMRGDANFSDFIDIDDVVFLIDYIFQGGPAPNPVEEAGDANADADVDIDDITFLLDYIFNAGPAPQN